MRVACMQRKETFEPGSYLGVGGAVPATASDPTARVHADHRHAEESGTRPRHESVLVRVVRRVSHGCMGAKRRELDEQREVVRTC